MECLKYEFQGKWNHLLLAQPPAGNNWLATLKRNIPHPDGWCVNFHNYKPIEALIKAQSRSNHGFLKVEKT
jgi:hypothetical protein